MSEEYNEDDFNLDSDYELSDDDHSEVDLAETIVEDEKPAVEEEQVAEEKDYVEIPKDCEEVVSNKGKYYLTNETLLPEVIVAKEKGIVTEKLGKMLLLMTHRISLKYNWRKYSFREDMVSFALLNLARNALKFNPEVSNNPFSYYTTAIERCFTQYVLIEKKQHYIRDSLLIQQGKDPSFNYEESIIKRRLEEKEQEKLKKKEASQKRKEVINRTLRY